MFKFLIAIVILGLSFLPISSQAEIIVPMPQNLAPKKVNHSRDFLGFQVIENQFVFNNATIHRATIITHRDGSFAGLRIELKPGLVVKELEKITTEGIGKRVNFVINNRIISTPIIQSPLGPKFVISSITKEEAQAFLIALNSNKKKRTTL